MLHQEIAGLRDQNGLNPTMNADKRCRVAPVVIQSESRPDLPIMMN